MIPHGESFILKSYTLSYCLERSSPWDPTPNPRQWRDLHHEILHSIVVYEWHSSLKPAPHQSVCIDFHPLGPEWSHGYWNLLFYTHPTRVRNVKPEILWSVLVAGKTLIMRYTTRLYCSIERPLPWEPMLSPFLYQVCHVSILGLNLIMCLIIRSAARFLFSTPPENLYITCVNGVSQCLVNCRI